MMRLGQNMETVTLKIEKSLGYGGKRSGKSYIAHVTGTDDRYIFAREFVATEATDRAEMFAARRKRKGTWIEAAAVEAGLYEISQQGEREYKIVYFHKDKNAMAVYCIDVDRATRIALMLDEGAEFDAARLATKPPAKAIIAGETEDPRGNL